MLKSSFLFFFFSVFTLQLAAQNIDKKLVLVSFEKYKEYILNDNGEEAIKYLDSRTKKYYNDILKDVINADSNRIEKLSLMDKMMILIIRQRVSKEEILNMNGEKLLIYAINNGMVGKNRASKNGIRNIYINKNFAKAELEASEKINPIYFHFYKEDGIWKIDLTALFNISNQAMKMLVEQSNQSENEYLLYLIELVSKKAIIETIWQPIELWK
jgi:hypothetical protein